MSLSADVFSYGMLLYEIFACKLQFADVKSDPVVSGKIMKGEVRTVPTHVVKIMVCIFYYKSILLTLPLFIRYRPSRTQ